VRWCGEGLSVHLVWLCGGESWFSSLQVEIALATLLD
jgi:hypothetical protein